MRWQAQILSAARQSVDLCRIFTLLVCIGLSHAANFAYAEVVDGREVGPCIGKIFVGLHGDWIIPSDLQYFGDLWFYRDGDGMLGRFPRILGSGEGKLVTSEEVLHVAPDGSIWWSGPKSGSDNDRKWQPVNWPRSNGRLVEISKLPKGAWVAQGMVSSAKSKKPPNAIAWCWMTSDRFLLGAPRGAKAIGSVCWLARTSTGFELILEGEKLCDVNPEKKLVLSAAGARLLGMRANTTLYWYVVDTKDRPTLPGKFYPTSFYTSVNGSKAIFKGRTWVDAIEVVY